MISAADNKLLVRRLVQEAVSEQNLDVLGQIAAGEFAEIAKSLGEPIPESVSRTSR